MPKSTIDKDTVSFLNAKVDLYNSQSFIKDDPISIPHRFSNPRDIEIVGLWTALLSWGQRKTIINKANELCQLMDNDPHAFIVGHKASDRKAFNQFKHRTFQPEDCYCFLEFFQSLYQKYESLEEAFYHEDGVEQGLVQFRNEFDAYLNGPSRTQKHISTPTKKSACKRLNMFLRWMVRKDNLGVDFGIWDTIQSKDLFIPLDVHVGRVARELNLLKRKQNDWLAVSELTNALRRLDPNDPVKYDYALFGIGVAEGGV